MIPVSMKNHIYDVRVVVTSEDLVCNEYSCNANEYSCNAGSTGD